MRKGLAHTASPSRRDERGKKEGRKGGKEELKKTTLLPKVQEIRNDGL